MPITTKLSHKLYETFGDEAAGEMIDWMQRVDAQRNEFREMHELTSARFESRLAEFDAKIQTRFAEIDARFSQIDGRFSQIDGRFSRLEKDMELGFARLETKIEQRTADIMKWSFVFWVGSVITLMGTLVTLSRYLR